MQVNWYDGLKTVNYLKIEYGTLHTIECGAFSSKVFKEMDTLVLTLNSPIEYKSCIWNGLNNLLILLLGDVHLFDANDNDYFLLPFAQTLSTYVSNFGHTDKDVQFNRFFANYIMTELREISFSYIRPQLDYRRMLAADNFSSFPVIQRIHIIDCGIEVIDADTFGRIGRTLIQLNLEQNNIKKLDATVFNVFFDKSQVPALPKLLNLTANEFVCGCEFYELKYLSLINIGRKSYETWRCSADSNALSMEMCPNLQIIRPDRIHPTHNITYAYPRIDLKLILKNALLLVKMINRDKYRVFIRNYNNYDNDPDLCFDRQWVSASINCFQFENMSDAIPIADYLRSDLTTICVIYADMLKHVWPLHCITIYRSRKLLTPFDVIWLDKFLIVIILILSSIIGVFLGLLIVPCRVQL